MNFIESLKMAFSSIAANKMRSLLTMLGIIIGISAVITITTLGSTLRSTVGNAMSSLGTNCFYMSLTPKDYDENKDYTVTDDDMITFDMLNELINKYPGEFSLAVSNQLSTGNLLNSSKNYVNVSVQGTFEGYFKLNNLDILSGRSISLRDNDEMKYTAVVSDIFVKQYFKNGEEPVGQKISVSLDTGNVIEVNIVGVYKYSEVRLGSFKPNTKFADRVTPVFIPYLVANKMSGNTDNNFVNAVVSWNTDFSNAKALSDITSFFNDKYSSNKNWEVNIENIQDQVKTIDMVINVVTAVVAVIAAISLLVGGVGVMNIMLVSVTERTREIGVRKALGAKKSAIKMQFVIEAIIICLFGGIIGIIIGILNGELVGIVANVIMKNYPQYSEVLGKIHIVPSVGAIVISVIFSMLTGVFFGLYPAGKAAKMNPIDALRYD